MIRRSAKPADRDRLQIPLVILSAEAEVVCRFLDNPGKEQAELASIARLLHSAQTLPDIAQATDELQEILGRFPGKPMVAVADERLQSRARVGRLHLDLRQAADLVEALTEPLLEVHLVAKSIRFELIELLAESVDGAL